MSRELEFNKICMYTKDFILYLYKKDDNKVIYHTYPLKNGYVNFKSILTIERDAEFEPREISIFSPKSNTNKRHYFIKINGVLFVAIDVNEKTVGETSFHIHKKTSQNLVNVLYADLTLGHIYLKTQDGPTGDIKYTSEEIDTVKLVTNKVIDETKYFVFLLFYDPEYHYLPHYRIYPKIDEDIIPVMVCDIPIDNDWLMNNPPIKFHKHTITLDSDNEDIKTINQIFTYTEKTEDSTFDHSENILMHEFEDGVIVHRTSENCDAGAYNITIFKEPSFTVYNRLSYSGMFDFMGSYMDSDVHIHHTIDTPILYI